MLLYAIVAHCLQAKFNVEDNNLSLFTELSAYCIYDVSIEFVNIRFY